jgi:glycosyltransferase involved in cell wall biosynthesis
MRICFIDFAPWDYNVVTPTLRPLGGSQSAMCYLAVELARLGHSVTVVTGTTKPLGTAMGVECHGPNVPIEQDAFDVVVALNAPKHGSRLRKLLSPSTRLILWTQHAANQPVMREGLSDPDQRDVWDGIVCVSEWQRLSVIDRFGISQSRVHVLRNAIAPAFENMFASHADLVAAKSGDTLRLAYTSTPYRGLKLLPDIFRPYREMNPDAALEVYSSMAVYLEDTWQDHYKFGPIYDAVSETSSAELIGSLSQPELAKRLRGAHILAYPNAFPETSCIAVMEALAAGMRVVTSDLGALPETCEGFAKLVPIDIDIDDANASIAVRNGASYTDAFVNALARSTYTTAGLYDQVVHMNTHHTWAVRAQQWVDYLNAA